MLCNVNRYIYIYIYTMGCNIYIYIYMIYIYIYVRGLVGVHSSWGSMSEVWCIHPCTRGNRRMAVYSPFLDKAIRGFVTWLKHRP